MHPAYFEVRFRTPDPSAEWPASFVILTAYATTGEMWTEEENRAADRRLGEVLLERTRTDLRRITGYSPATDHAEPGWAATLPFDEACDIGVRFHQDALYVVHGDALHVSYCDARRALVPAGSFRARLDGAPEPDEPVRE